VQCALDSFGRIDAVVNNAGILRDRFFHKMSVDEFDAVIKVHLYGAYHVSRAAANHFKEQGSGAFVHMTSTSGPDRQLRPGQLQRRPSWASRPSARALRWTCRSSTCAATASRRSPGAA
jgi:NAD(P)-dependent dehydrogenase (short-subunit alcohol dehydrogenase family)